MEEVVREAVMEVVASLLRLGEEAVVVVVTARRLM